jgi:hypothetical protein
VPHGSELTAVLAAEAFQQADVVFTNSESASRRLSLELPSGKITVLPVGFDLDGLLRGEYTYKRAGILRLFQPAA